MLDFVLHALRALRPCDPRLHPSQANTITRANTSFFFHFFFIFFIFFSFLFHFSLKVFKIQNLVTPSILIKKTFKHGSRILPVTKQPISLFSLFSSASNAVMSVSVKYMVDLPRWYELHPCVDQFLCLEFFAWNVVATGLGNDNLFDHLPSTGTHPLLVVNLFTGQTLTYGVETVALLLTWHKVVGNCCKPMEKVLLYNFARLANF